LAEIGLENVRFGLAPFLPCSSTMSKGSKTIAGRERSLLISDAAELLGLSRRSVYYRIREGRLRTIRTRGGSQRVLLSSIERLLREMRNLPPLDERSRETPPADEDGSETEALAF
jgi:excisionase family DNA binding protein